jgi:hypothetical protein
MTGALFLSRTVLAQWFDPRHDQIENSKKLFELTLKLDSLEDQVMQKDLFISTFQNIISGNVDSSTYNLNMPEAQLINANFDVGTLM